jgi:hypothetical protein
MMLLEVLGGVRRCYEEVVGSEEELGGVRRRLWGGFDMYWDVKSWYYRLVGIYVGF